MTPDVFRSVEAVIADADRDELPVMIGDLARLQAIATARLAAPNGRGPELETEPDIKPDRPERLLDVHEAAERLGVSERWLYDRSDTLPFVRRLGARTLRFSAAGIERWLATRR